MTLAAGFRIGEREVFPLEGRIAGPGGSLRVEPKAMAVLLELARHALAVRSRDQIVQVVWPRGYVSDDVLTRCIGQLRRALGDDPRAPTFLETLPKHGYRLRSVPTLRRSGSSTPGQLAGQRAESLIVLPFRHLCTGVEAFIAEGLTELLILRLCGLRQVRVISRTTAMQFKGDTTSMAEIVTRTGVDWVVEGSILQSGDQLQVIAQLIDARTDAHIWAADYLRDLRDLLPLQNEIAFSIASAIRAQLGTDMQSSRTPPSLPPQVMRDVLRGRHLISRRTVAGLSEALGRFEAVTAAAPDYAAGWASRAECELLLAHYGAPDLARLLIDVQTHVDRALAIEPEQGIALSARGAARLFFQADLDGAQRDLESALHQLPSYALAMVSMANLCAIRRQFADATAWMEQALLVDPLDVGINMNFGDHMILQRRFGDAVRALCRALEIAPGHRPSQLRCCWALALAGRCDEAMTQMASIGPADEADVTWIEYAALVAAATGDADSASRYHESLARLARSHRVPAWTMARAAAAAGRHDEAIGWIEVARRNQSSSMPFLALTPAFDILHSNARFRVLANGVSRPPCGLGYGHES